MTAPTITYGHGYLCDMDSATYWGAKTDSADPLTGVSITCNDDDVIEIEGTCDNAANEYVYYAYDMTNISSTLYPYVTIRYRTSASSNGLFAKVKLVFTAGTQTVLDGAYSTEWTEITVDITTAKTIDKVEIWADDTDAVDAGTFQVYFDFVMIHKGTWTFPACDVEDFELENQYADISIPGRSGDVTQFLGSKSHPLTLVGTMENWETWGSGSGASQAFGEYLKDIFDNADTEPWQWFTSDFLTDKVTLRKFNPKKDSSAKSPRTWRVELKRFSLSDYDADSWA